MAVTNNERQRTFRSRSDQGLAIIRVEVDLEVVAATLNRLGYRPVLQDRGDVARAVERLLADLAARDLR